MGARVTFPSNGHACEGFLAVPPEGRKGPAALPADGLPFLDETRPAACVPAAARDVWRRTLGPFRTNLRWPERTKWKRVRSR